VGVFARIRKFFARVFARASVGMARSGGDREDSVGAFLLILE